MLMGEAKLVMNEENIYNKPIKPEKLFLESTDLCAWESAVLSESVSVKEASLVPRPPPRLHQAVIGHDYPLVGQR